MLRNAALLCLALLPGVSTRAAEEKAEPRHTPSPKLTAIAEDSWEKVAGFAPTSGGILAYSGGTYDSVNQQFLIFGGGHADYWEAREAELMDGERPFRL